MQKYTEAAKKILSRKHSTNNFLSHHRDQLRVSSQLQENANSAPPGCPLSPQTSALDGTHQGEMQKRR